jgi:hypothetical protein
MNIIEEESSDDIKKLNEMYVTLVPSLSPGVTNSIYYNKLKYLMFNDIVQYCKEKLELKSDLLNLRSYIGDYLSEDDIEKYLDSLKKKYNGSADPLYQNIGIEYHIETTRIDYGVAVFCVIKRDDIYMKKFVFRFRKTPLAGLDIANLTNANMPLPSTPETRAAEYAELMGTDRPKEERGGHNA